MNWMLHNICWLTHSDDLDVKARFFEPQDLLRNERFRKPWIAFQHHDDFLFCRQAGYLALSTTVK